MIFHLGPRSPPCATTVRRYLLSASLSLSSLSLRFAHSLGPSRAACRRRLRLLHLDSQHAGQPAIPGGIIAVLCFARTAERRGMLHSHPRERVNKLLTLSSATALPCPVLSDPEISKITGVRRAGGVAGTCPGIAKRSLSCLNSRLEKGSTYVIHKFVAKGICCSGLESSCLLFIHNSTVLGVW